MDVIFIVLLLTTLTLLAIYQYVPVTGTMTLTRGAYGAPPPPYPPGSQGGGGGGGGSGGGDGSEEGGFDEEEGGFDEEGEEGFDEEEAEIEGELETEQLEEGEFGESAEMRRNTLKKLLGGTRFMIPGNARRFTAQGGKKFMPFVTTPKTGAALLTRKFSKNNRVCAPANRFPKTPAQWKQAGFSKPQTLVPPTQAFKTGAQKFQPMRNFTKPVSSRKKFAKTACVKVSTPDQLKKLSEYVNRRQMRKKQQFFARR